MRGTRKEMGCGEAVVGGGSWRLGLGWTQKHGEDHTWRLVGWQGVCPPGIFTGRK